MLQSLKEMGYAEEAINAKVVKQCRQFSLADIASDDRFYVELDKPGCPVRRVFMYLRHRSAFGSREGNTSDIFFSSFFLRSDVFLQLVFQASGFASPCMFSSRQYAKHRAASWDPVAVNRSGRGRAWAPSEVGS